MANNTDDHNKNFAFLLEEGGRWHIAPAYDMTFIFNDNGTGPNINHRLSICGKISEITKADLIGFATDNDIRNAVAIIDDVARALEKFDEYADQNNISEPWRGLIRKTISDNLAESGYLTASDTVTHFTDRYGRTVDSPSLAVNGLRGMTARGGASSQCGDGY